MLVTPPILFRENALTKTLAITLPILSTIVNCILPFAALAAGTTGIWISLPFTSATTNTTLGRENKSTSFRSALLLTALNLCPRPLINPYPSQIFRSRVDTFAMLAIILVSIR
jgi:hypothetical protein